MTTQTQNNNHLTQNDIFAFVTAELPLPEYLELASRVNYHICRCRECFELVNALLIMEEVAQEECVERTLNKELLRKQSGNRMTYTENKLDYLHNDMLDNCLRKDMIKSNRKKRGCISGSKILSKEK